MKRKLLIVDDEPGLRRIVQMALEDLGYLVVTAGSAEDAAELLAAEPVDLVVTDLQLPGRSGLELLSDLRRDRPSIPVILITAFGTVETAVEAIKAGAFDYVLKPFGIGELEVLVADALSHPSESLAHATGRRPESELPGGAVVTPGLAGVMDQVGQVAPAPTTVLITGETGVGKEVVARAIHANSGRGDAAFVAVNCAAIPGELLEAELFGAERGAYTGAVKDRPGKFEMADGGTIFLDEIGDMPLAMQAKLLRVLEDHTVERLGSGVPRKVDVRVVAATHQDIAARVAGGDFREDLYYRINVFPIHLPPLRERPDDIAPLAEAILDRFEGTLGVRARLADTALRTLEAYAWPGNVRELTNVLERAVLTSPAGIIESVELSATGRGGEAFAETEVVRPLGDAVALAEREAIERALERTGDNKAQAARLLGISVRTLWYKLEKLGLS
jgi:two-component system, NtrC family, response regulator AtoC